MTSQLVARLRRALIAISALATIWVLIVLLTDGFVINLPGLTVSSRNPRNPALAAIISAVAAWALPVPDRRRAAHDSWLRWRRRGEWMLAHRPAWTHAAIVVALAGGAVQVAAWNGNRPLWLDEEMIALNVRDRTFTALAGALWLDQAAPLGWLALQRSALVTFGTGEVALRAVPLSFGVAMLVVAAWAGRRWLGEAAAALFVLLCAVGSWLAHYPLELKHYSADAFWALLLPTLSVWAIEAAEPQHQLRRARIWWATAAVAHWFSNGGLFVVPACVAVLLLALWPRVRTRALIEMTAGGIVLLASFTLHFILSIRHALGSEYLRNYWSGGLPPQSADVTSTLTWLAAQLRPLAVNPGGTELWALFWVAAIGGCLLASRHLRGVLLSIPLTSFVLGGLAIVPLLDRVALWIVPTLYFGLASLADWSIRMARDGLMQRRITRLLAASGACAVVLVVCADVIQRGWAGVQYRRVSDRNHGLDDRAAARWLVARRQPGDAVVTTQLALPALWWYGGIDISQGAPPGSSTTDGTRIFAATYVPAAQCADTAAPASLSGVHRVLVYVGFPDAPPGFADLLVNSLAQDGMVQEDRSFADASRVAVVQLARNWRATVADGCIGLRVASRW